MNSTFTKFSKIRNNKGLTGADVAIRILNSKGLYNVQVERVSGKLIDHFDPKSNVVRLSESTNEKGQEKKF